MNKQLKYQTKKGGASIYVTIFVALIISVVTLSFARLTISELAKSGDTDLNQSAYDSALAGVEDAKLAIATCLKSGRTLGECNIASSNPDECNKFLKSGYINGRAASSDGSVMIEERTNNTSNNSGKVTSQSYTCVVVDNNLPEYLSELSSEYRVRMVPLKTNNPDDLKNLSSVVLSWYGSLSDSERSSDCSGDTCYFNERSKAPTPPVISVSVIQAGENFNRNDLSNTANGKYGNVVLYPNGSNNSTIQKIIKSELVSYVDGGSTNRPIPVNCYTDDSYACSVEIELPDVNGQRYNGSTYLVVAMPYDNTSTPFRVTMKRNGSTVNFYDAQVAVDSTGRANDIYRRVESRVDLMDTYFPYPLYGLEATAASSGSIDKDFWVTRNCWSAKAGEVEECNNSGQLNSEQLNS